MRLWFPLFLTLFFLSACTAQVQPNVQSATFPEFVASDFYSDWFNYPGDPAVDRYYAQHPLVTQNLVNQLDEWAQGPGYGVVDPFLCSSEMPSSIVTTTEDETDGKDQVTVFVDLQFGSEYYRVSIDMRLVDGAWLLHQIECPTGPFKPDYR